VPGLTLYSREGCPLCDERAAALLRLGIAFRRVDVDEDPELARCYGTRVPVLVTTDGRELAMDLGGPPGIG
jgi:glutaredoxin